MPRIERPKPSVKTAATPDPANESGYLTSGSGCLDALAISLIEPGQRAKHGLTEHVVMKLLFLRVLAASFFTLSACTQDAPLTAGKSSTATTAAGSSYADPQHRFAIAIRGNTTLLHDFQSSYFDHAAWKAFADPDSHGTPAVALVLNGSNKITLAELRIDTSADGKAVARCVEAPDSGVPSSCHHKTGGTVTPAQPPTHQVRDRAR